MIHNKRKKDLLEMVLKHGLDGYIVPSTDSWQNECPSAHHQRLAWLTGFSGSNGVAIVTNSTCYFYTDSRYLVQARIQLGRGYEVLDMSEPSSCILSGCEGNLLGYDPMLFSVKTASYYKKWGKKNGIKLEQVSKNLVDTVWLDSPLKDASQPYIIPSESEAQTKLNLVYQGVHHRYTLLCRPESICWLLNVRASDLENTPVMLSYLLLDSIEKKGELFVDMLPDGPSSVNGMLGYFNSLNLECFGLDELMSRLCLFPSRATCTVLSDFRFLPAALEETSRIFSPSGDISVFIDEPDPCLAMAAIKTPEELENIKQAHISDGLAVTKFMIWLYEQEMDSVDEITASRRLLEFRQRMPNFRGESFPAISGYGANGAIVHYRASPETNKVIGRDSLYLIDSGGQYFYGTTDVTRTLCLGLPTFEQKAHFTAVLRGHMLLANARFPPGTTGAQLDVLARYYLWQESLDYGHGTGHGVGYFLSVHEGPQSISRKNDVPLQVGMVVSIEPGLYLEGKYGIRIENLYVIKEWKNGYMRFEPLTMVPINASLIDFYSLNDDEKEWINDYHDLVLMEIGKYLSEKETERLCKII